MKLLNKMAFLAMTLFVVGCAMPGSELPKAPNSSSTTTTTNPDPASTATPASITLDKSELTIKVGEDSTLTATVKDKDGVVLTGQTVVWTVSDGTIVSVDAGKTSGLKAGSSDVIAKIGEFTATCKITVSPADVIIGPPVFVTSITLSETSKSLKVGETFTLTSTVAPENATDKKVIWSSSDETVATVSDDGVVTALKSGSVKIKGASNDGTKIEGACDFTVTDSIVISETLVIQKKDWKFAGSRFLKDTGENWSFISPVSKFTLTKAANSGEAFRGWFEGTDQVHYLIKVDGTMEKTEVLGFQSLVIYWDDQLGWICRVEDQVKDGVVIKQGWSISLSYLQN